MLSVWENIFKFVFAKNFNLDASSDALLLEGDKDLRYLREVNSRYGSKDFLFLTYFFENDATKKVMFTLKKLIRRVFLKRVINGQHLAAE